MARSAGSLSFRGYLRRRGLVYVAVIGLFAAGMVAGAVSAGEVGPQRRNELASYVQALTGEAADRPDLAQLMRWGVWEHGVRTVGLVWLLGLSIIGAPFILGVVFLRGFGLGFTTGFLLEERVFEGVVLTLAGVLPHHVFAIPGILLAGGAALSFSAVAAAIILGRRELSALSQFVASTFLCLLGFGLLLTGTLVEAYITPVLLRAVGSFVSLW